MSRFESAPGAEVSNEDDVSLTSQDYFEVANALKQKGGREAASPETRAQRAEERRQSRRDALRNAALAVPEKFDVLESRVWTSYLKPPLLSRTKTRSQNAYLPHFGRNKAARG